MTNYFIFGVLLVQTFFFAAMFGKAMHEKENPFCLIVFSIFLSVLTATICQAVEIGGK